MKKRYSIFGSRHTREQVILLLMIFTLATVWGTMRDSVRVQKDMQIILSKNIDSTTVGLIQEAYPQANIVRSTLFGDDSNFITIPVNKNKLPSAKETFSRQLFIKFWRDDSTIAEVRKSLRSCKSVFCPFLIGSCCESNVCDQNFAALLVSNAWVPSALRFSETKLCSNTSDNADVHIHVGVLNKNLYVMSKPISDSTDLFTMKHSGYSIVYCTSTVTNWGCAALFLQKIQNLKKELDGFERIIFTEEPNFKILQRDITQNDPFGCLSYTSDAVVPVQYNRNKQSSLPHILMAKAFLNEVPPSFDISWYHTTGGAVQLLSLLRGSNQFYKRFRDVLRVVGSQHFLTVLQYALGNDQKRLGDGCDRNMGTPFSEILQNIDEPYMVKQRNGSMFVRKQNSKQTRPLIVLKSATSQSVNILLNEGYSVYFSTTTEENGHIKFILNPEENLLPCTVFLQGHVIDTYYQRTTPNLESFLDDLDRSIACCIFSKRYVALGKNVFSSLWKKYTLGLPEWWNTHVGDVKKMDTSKSVLSLDSGGQFVIPSELLQHSQVRETILKINSLPRSVFNNDGIDYPLATPPTTTPTSSLEELLLFTWHFIFGEDQISKQQQCKERSINLQFETRGLRGIVKHNKKGAWTENTKDWNQGILVVLSGDAKHRYECVAHMQRKKINVWVSLHYSTCSNYKLNSPATRIPCREIYGYYAYLSDPERPSADYIILSHAHVRSWHQPFYLSQAISHALPEVKRSQRYTTMTHRWNVKVWTDGAEEVADEYNNLISDLPEAVKMKKKLVMHYCCAQGIVPYNSIRGVPLSVFTRIFESVSRNLLYSSGWYLEKVLTHSLGDDKAIELIPLKTDLSPQMNRDTYTYPNNHSGTIWRDGTIVPQPLSEPIQLLVVIGKYDPMQNKTSEFTLWVPSEMCTASNACNTSWGYISYLSDIHRPEADLVIFVPTLQDLEIVKHRINAATECLVNRPGSNYAPLLGYGKRLERDSHRKVVLEWNDQFSDLEYVLHAGSEIVSYENLIFIVSYNSLTQNLAYWTYYLRVWRMVREGSPKIEQLLSHFWHILFTWEENFSLTVACWNYPF